MQDKKTAEDKEKSFNRLTFSYIVSTIRAYPNNHNYQKTTSTIATLNGKHYYIRTTCREPWYITCVVSFGKLVSLNMHPQVLLSSVDKVLR